VPAGTAIGAESNQLGWARNRFDQRLAAAADKIAFSFDRQGGTGDFRSPVQHGVVAHVIDVGSSVFKLLFGRS
jgi:hypothetical protein